ncbi:hypothetical protein P152DRAFT_446176 [Eremomyces bilateralis CBS 781.70]|uniref:Uncharacterized protein n=1 Tax=Eremomyces bilateralis CBS 781.70 TaxID=1392243 RepID=A0A6G1GEV0_9PEZI|nr:uncharacterized protein P152DRAFT_446176 [Eremomyces bilateralis CBS 781.70]KAF1816532.1 hypothetical protein P152DRAFT_446176 [Eremomyces bilateralis CBS 781.70]
MKPSLFPLITTIFALALAQVPPDAQCAKDGSVAAFAGTRESANVAQKFFTTAYTDAGTLSFHAGNASHQLGLSGKLGSGMLELVDLVNPTGKTIKPDNPTMWSVFTVGQGGVLGIKDGTENTLKDRTWVAWLETDGTYHVGLWDGVTKQPRTTSNVQVIAERAQAPLGS